MHKSVNALTSIFLSLGLFLVAPSFAEEVKTPETPTFTAEEIQELAKAIRHRQCRIASKVMRQSWKDCDKKIEYTFEQSKNFDGAMKERYGGTGALDRILLNSLPKVNEEIERQKLQRSQPKPQ